MGGSRGGGGDRGSGPPPPPWNCQIINFCYVEIFSQTPSGNLDPLTHPEKIFWIRACFNMMRLSMMVSGCSWSAADTGNCRKRSGMFTSGLLFSPLTRTCLLCPQSQKYFSSLMFISVPPPWSYLIYQGPYWCGR